MLSDDMHENLVRFYHWSKTHDPADVGYPHQTPFRRLLGSSVGCEQLSDEEAGLINRALCVLREGDGEAYALIRRVYDDGKTLRWMEQHREGDRKRNGRILASAHSFLKGFLIGAIAA